MLPDADSKDQLVTIIQSVKPPTAFRSDPLAEPFDTAYQLSLANTTTTESQ